MTNTQQQLQPLKELDKETAKLKSNLTPKQLELLKEVEESHQGAHTRRPHQQQQHRLGSKWSFDEAKFASTGILGKLTKVLPKVRDKEEESEEPAFSPELQRELEKELSQNYSGLVSDTVVERREWQTDCYLDYRLSKNTNPFLTTVPDGEGQESNATALQSFIAVKDKEQQQQQQQKKKKTTKEEKALPKTEKKKVRMSSEVKSSEEMHAHRSSPERPNTARSILSNLSFRSDFSDDGRASQLTTDYDRLPAELRPSILHYRRESALPRMKRKPETRMEKVLREKERTAKRSKD